eukprot:scaffold10577_cov40-Prasinocladus_malaysianus.AAC.1
MAGVVQQQRQSAALAALRRESNTRNDTKNVTYCVHCNESAVWPGPTPASIARSGGTKLLFGA